MLSQHFSDERDYAYDRSAQTSPGTTRFFLSIHLPSDSTSRWTPLLFSYSFPTTWACSGLSPARARPWRANETCAARRTQRKKSPLVRLLSSTTHIFLTPGSFAASMRLPLPVPALPGRMQPATKSIPLVPRLQTAHRIVPTP